MTDTDSQLPPEAWATALSSLEGMGPRRLAALLAHHREPRLAWAAVAGGALHRVPELAGPLGPARVSSGGELA